MADRTFSECELLGRNKCTEYFPEYTYDYTQDPYCPYDFTSTATTNPDRTYVGEIKYYIEDKSSEYYRPHDKFKDYQIDYDKLKKVETEALARNGVPVLVVFFSDSTYVWNLTEDKEWEDNKRWVWTNAEGVNYGRKTLSLQSYLNFNKAIYVGGRDRWQ